MKLDFRMNLTRLFVDSDLEEQAIVQLNSAQSHYLSSVLRKKNGFELILFNGRDGGFLCTVETSSKRSISVYCKRKVLSQTTSPDLWILFVPIKRTRMDFLVQKVTELGASKIWPVQSEFGQVKQIKNEKIRSHTIEAAEQTERLDLPEIGNFMKLQTVLETWPVDRMLIVCDETKSEINKARPMTALNSLRLKKAAILIGPEGGFSSKEQKKLKSYPFTEHISLGPRILRSDTAAIAALSIFQANFGDWYKPPSLEMLNKEFNGRH